MVPTAPEEAYRWVGTVYCKDVTCDLHDACGVM